ncbi:MAG: MauE/DoxX family redox-associated membrane protein [Chloroflexota bacterium]
MGLVTFILELYFAAMLGVSGLAKAEQPERFADTLRRHRILPRQSIDLVSRLFPWAEVALAGLLVTGEAQHAAAIATVAIFATFSAIEVVLVTTKRATECGCYGVAYSQRVDHASVATSTVLTVVAATHLWLVGHATPVDWQWRLGGSILLLVAGAWIGWRILSRKRSWRPRGNPGTLVETRTA